MAVDDASSLVGGRTLQWARSPAPPMDEPGTSMAMTTVQTGTEMTVAATDGTGSARSRWGSMATVSQGPDTVSPADVAISNDQFSVSISDNNVDDGYHLILTSIGPVLTGSTDGGRGAAEERMRR